MGTGSMIIHFHKIRQLFHGTNPDTDSQWGSGVEPWKIFLNIQTSAINCKCNFCQKQLFICNTQCNREANCLILGMCQNKRDQA